MAILNDAQQRAVTHPGGPALVLAGAGTGKTRVIVERLAWLVGEQGVDPRRLLALTFTNRAAGEMRDRVARRLNQDRFGAWVGTFHSFGLYLLRREMDKLGRSERFTVFDDADQLGLMKRLLRELPTRWARVSPRAALSWVSLLKQGLHGPESAPAESREEETYHELWRRYHEALARAEGVDFDDLLVLPARLLERDDVRARYSSRFRYVHIDEYQDTNRAQYMIACRLSDGAGNLFAVGDEDQSIYSWRGATIQNILDFERDFPGAAVYRLEENYRSTGAILSVANAVVAHNQRRLGKNLWTAAGPGDPVRYYEAADAEDEARFVVDELAASAIPPQHSAVLYRTNGQARVLEEALRRKSMAYVVVGGVSFYGRKEVKDILAYLRLLVNPNDDESLRRIVNTPTRGIGGHTLEQIDGYVAARGVSLLTVLREVEHDQSFSTRARDAVARFVHLLDDLAVAARREGVAPLVEAVLEKTGYRAYVQHADERDFRVGLEIIDEFVAACRDFDARGKGDLGAFLQDLSLMTDADRFDPEAPAVKLLTCHSAKGLEFEQVFLIGLEEGLLPHASALDSDSEIEEERRLCYVAMTRAGRRLTLSAASSRVVFGEGGARRVSRFVQEIPAGMLEALGRRSASPRETRRREPTAQSAPVAAADGLKMGTRVRHARFGAGTVMYTKGSGAKLRAHIRFDTGQSREFMVSAAPLEILEGKRR